MPNFPMLCGLRYSCEAGIRRIVDKTQAIKNAKVLKPVLINSARRGNIRGRTIYFTTDPAVMALWLCSTMLSSFFPKSKSAIVLSCPTV